MIHKLVRNLYPNTKITNWLSEEFLKKSGENNVLTAKSRQQNRISENYPNKSSEIRPAWQASHQPGRPLITSVWPTPTPSSTNHRKKNAEREQKLSEREHKEGDGSALAPPMTFVVDGRPKPPPGASAGPERRLPARLRHLGSNRRQAGVTRRSEAPPQSRRRSGSRSRRPVDGRRWDVSPRRGLWLSRGVSGANPLCFARRSHFFAGSLPSATVTLTRIGCSFLRVPGSALGVLLNMDQQWEWKLLGYPHLSFKYCVSSLVFYPRFFNFNLCSKESVEVSMQCRNTHAEKSIHLKILEWTSMRDIL